MGGSPCPGLRRSDHHHDTRLRSVLVTSQAVLSPGTFLVPFTLTVTQEEGAASSPAHGRDGRVSLAC